MTKEQLKDYLRQLSDEAGDCGNSEEWVKLRHDALVAVIDALVTTPVEPSAKQEAHQGPLHQAVEDLGFWLLTRKAHEAEERGEQRIPCFIQIEWVERVAKLLGYAYPPENRPAEPT